MGGGARGIGVGFLGGGVPELEKSKGQITSQITQETVTELAVVFRLSEKQAIFVLVRPVSFKGLYLFFADDIEAIDAIEAMPVQMRVIKQDPSEVIGE